MLMWVKNLKEHNVCKLFWNPATFSCKNGKYLVKDSAITHDEIMENADSYQQPLRLLCNKIFIIKR